MCAAMDLEDAGAYDANFCTEWLIVCTSVRRSVRFELLQM